MSRVFDNLSEAALEIRRDLAKSTQIAFTRVQQHVDQELLGRESLSYEYVVRASGMPSTAAELVQFGQDHGFKPYIEHGHEMQEWLIQELDERLYPYANMGRLPTELSNPLLKKTVEGNWPSYTYRERLSGALPTVMAALKSSMDTRRAFWPIFLPQDALRAGYPTRVPCSLGYEVMIRNVVGTPKVHVFYLERSCDFDRFWLSDIWFAYRFGHEVAKTLGLEVGSVTHYIISLHSFEVEMNEIY